MEKDENVSNLGNPSLGERLRQARLDSKLTQHAAAEKVGVDPNTIARYEAGRIKPSSTALFALAQVYGRPVEWFFGEEEEPPPSPTQQEDPDPDPQSTYEEDMAFIESVPQLAFRGQKGDLTPEEARTIRELIELMRANKRENT